MLSASPSSPERFDEQPSLKVQTPEFRSVTEEIDRTLKLSPEDAKAVELHERLVLSTAISIEDDFFDGKSYMTKRRDALDGLKLQLRSGGFTKQLPNFTEFLMSREGGPDVTVPDTVADEIEAAVRKGRVRKTIGRMPGMLPTAR